MRKWMTALVALTWAAVLLGGSFRPRAPGAGTVPRPQAGYRAPALVAESPDGRAVELASLQGQAVFLNFWASWCGPCRMEMPEVQRLAANLPEGATLITVNMTAQETSPAAVNRFLAANGYTFPVAMDPRGTAGDAYQVLSLPTSFFIGPDGVIRARINGPLSYKAMADFLAGARR